MVRFIDPAAWVDLSGDREEKLGVGVKGGFYLNYTKFVNNGQWNFVKTGKTLNEIQFTMDVIQMQNY